MIYFKCQKIRIALNSEKHPWMNTTDSKMFICDAMVDAASAELRSNGLKTQWQRLRRRNFGLVCIIWSFTSEQWLSEAQGGFLREVLRVIVGDLLVQTIDVSPKVVTKFGEALTKQEHRLSQIVPGVHERQKEH